LDGFLWLKRGELMVFCGDLDGRFAASKSITFEKYSVDFWRASGRRVDDASRD
jgi:hypothetical protein